MKVEWLLVQDDDAHWHYEKVEREYCCDLVHLQRVCLGCPGVDAGEEPPTWHAALHCPFCRGPGVEVDNSSATR